MNAAQLEQIVVAGSGTMGASIAQIFAEHGFSVTLYNRSLKGIERAKILIGSNQSSLVAAGRLSETDSQSLLSRIAFTQSEYCFHDAAFLIESIAENTEIKQDFEKTTATWEHKPEFEVLVGKREWEDYLFDEIDDIKWPGET